MGALTSARAGPRTPLIRSTSSLTRAGAARGPGQGERADKRELGNMEVEPAVCGRGSDRVQCAGCVAWRCGGMDGSLDLAGEDSERVSDGWITCWFLFTVVRLVGASRTES